MQYFEMLKYLYCYKVLDFNILDGHHVGQVVEN